MKAVTLFNWRLGGRARDFNWHNFVGLWGAPVLLVLTLTGDGGVGQRRWPRR